MKGFIIAEQEKSVEKVFYSRDSKVEEGNIALLNSLAKKKKELENAIDRIVIEKRNFNKKNKASDDLKVPEDTKVEVDLQSNNIFKCADLSFLTSDKLIIKSVIVISEQLYKGDTMVKYPETEPDFVEEEANKTVIQIKTEKDMNINLHIKVLVGTSFYNSDFAVFEFSKIIPKYCFYILLKTDNEEYEKEIEQGIEIKTNERIDRLIIWLSNNFNIKKEELKLYRDDNYYDVRFQSLRTDKVIQFSMVDNKLSIRSDEIELVGSTLQDICEYFNIEEGKTNHHFPFCMSDISSLSKRIENLDKDRNHYSINMNEIISFIKDLFVRAEDSRLLSDM